VYIDTGSSVPGVPSKSHDLADENIFFDGMEMIRNNRIVFVSWYYIHIKTQVNRNFNTSTFLFFGI
jgi:hypothetical protein